MVEGKEESVRVKQGHDKGLAVLTNPIASQGNVVCGEEVRRE